MRESVETFHWKGLTVSLGCPSDYLSLGYFCYYLIKRLYEFENWKCFGAWELFNRLWDLFQQTYFNRCLEQDSLGVSHSFWVIQKHSIVDEHNLIIASIRLTLIRLTSQRLSQTPQEWTRL